MKYSVAPAITVRKENVYALIRVVPPVSGPLQGVEKAYRPFVFVRRRKASGTICIPICVFQRVNEWRRRDGREEISRSNYIHE